MHLGKLGNLKMISESFWREKRVFVTGHTGFKGGWLSLWLTKLGAKVKGFSLPAKTEPSFFNLTELNKTVDSELGDIRNFDSLKKSINNFSPEIIFHLAAQPLVRYSYLNPVETFQTNVLGTANLLESALSQDSIQSTIIITTDKCYENDGRRDGYFETDPMGGRDPYSSSKGCAELIVSSYRISYFSDRKKGISSVRAGNVIGGGDWSEDRLIPDIIRSFKKNEEVKIRNPEATRPWQYVLEPLRGYLMLAQKLNENVNKYSTSFNFGPKNEDIKPVKWLVENMSNKWTGSKWSIDRSNNPHEEKYLSLNINKSRELLGWEPLWNLDKTISCIMEWHDSIDKLNMYKRSFEEIESYEKYIISHNYG